jgi:outer membrane protein assembly factor BamB
LYVAAGDGDLSLLAMRPNGAGRLSGDAVTWSTGTSVPKRSSQILIGDMLWMIDDKGVASCLDADSGKSIWRERVGGDFWASPIAGDGRIYFCSKQGKCVVIAADREFKVLAENQLGDGFVASPAVVENDLLLRTSTHLYRIGS